MDASARRKEVTLRIAGPHQFAAFLLFFIAPPFLYFLCTPMGREKTALWLTILLVTLLMVCVIWIGLEVFVSRLVATETTLTIYNLLNRKLVEVAYSEIDAYRPGKDGRWRICIGEAVYTPPRVDLGEMHRLMRMMAPKALGAKRWKCGQVPPEEDLVNLRPFDAPFLAPYLGGSCSQSPSRSYSQNSLEF